MELEDVNTEITVQSANVDLGDTFRDYAKQNIIRTAGKYFGQLHTASVYVNREGMLFRCTVNIQMGALKIMSAESQHKDCYAAFRSALEKVEKQLRRAKRELRDDKPVRIDKDMALRDGLRGAASST